MTLSGRYLTTDTELVNVNNHREDAFFGIRSQKREDKVYTYDEAIDLAGNGWYIIGLLVTLSCAFAGMALDMYGLSLVVTSACDLELTLAQKTTLLLMPFLGSVVMAYPWGYIADTQGRLKGLSVSLWGSFILASLSAFSPNWIVLAVLRFGSSSLSSGIQCLSLTLLGESCSSKAKGPSLIGMTTPILFTFTTYSVFGYFILPLEFSFDLGFIVFKSWRLLTLVLALPLGISAVFSRFFYESPKFLLNEGQEEKALAILKKISKRSGFKDNHYPVKRVVLNETTSLIKKDVPLLQSLMDQTFPLFKPPLLYRTIQLYYITAVVFASNNGFFSSLPLVIDSFILGFGGSGTDTTNMCAMLSSSSVSAGGNTCIPTVNETTVLVTIVFGVLLVSLNLVAACLSRWKKAVLLISIIISSSCGFLIPLVNGSVLTIALFFGYFISSVSLLVIFSYYVDLFPTSYRGMAACLGVTVARMSGLIGTYLVSVYLVSHCAYSFYAWSIFLLSGVVACCFLPAEPKK